MHFSLVKLMPEGHSAANGLDDVILPVRHALEHLGFAVEIKVNEANPQSRNIIFGSCNAPESASAAFPRDSIVFNLEQFTGGSPWLNSAYARHLADFQVWDYSPRNVALLKGKLGLSKVVGIRLGYVPEMTRLNDSIPQDVDVLFYGLVNERRELAMQKLAAAGIHVKILQGAYGAERDVWIARAKILLNVHYFASASLEVPRLGYLWANKKAVLSEFGLETERAPELSGACRYCSFDELGQYAAELLADDKAREKQARAGFEAFSSISLAEELKTLVGSRAFAPRKFAGRPSHLHVGSGKDFRPEALNVDISPLCNPDLILDVSQPMDFSSRHETRRFGPITLKRASFKRITAFELLEHVRDLPQTMRNFLDLLDTGGELELSVPYDLSLGAWQDPTHVRGFNENSWLYYTHWAWYLGWREERFELVKLRFTLSESGKGLEKQGTPMDVLLRTPRAVDGMNVVLRKRKATEKEIAEHDMRFRVWLRPGSVDWTIK